MMKKFTVFLYVFLVNSFFANAYYHEFEGVSETYSIRFLRGIDRFLPENPIIVEAGAYHGGDTVKIATHFPKASIYVFEPLSTAFPKLLETISPFPNVIAENIALDSETGQKPFYICHGAYGASPIFEFHSSLLKPTGSAKINLMGPIGRVFCKSLNDWSRDHQIHKIDMLFLSAEGNELQILEGAGTLLNDITLVYVRTQLFPSRRNITLANDLIMFMKKRGFTLLSHFFIKNTLGDALFIKNEKFYK